MPLLTCTCGAKHNFTDASLRASAGKPFRCGKCGKTRRLPLANLPSATQLSRQPQYPAPIQSPPIPQPTRQPSPAPQSITCPDCGSENCQRVKMIYELGTSQSTGISNSIFAGGFGGSHGFGSGLTLTSGTVQSNFAASVTPPSHAVERNRDLRLYRRRSNRFLRGYSSSNSCRGIHKARLFWQLVFQCVRFCVRNCWRGPHSGIVRGNKKGRKIQRDGMAAILRRMGAEIRVH